MGRGAEEWQSITHAGRMHQGPRRASTGPQGATGGTGGHSATGDALTPSRVAQEPHTLSEVERGHLATLTRSQTPQDAPQTTTGGTGRGASTHRTPYPQRAHRSPTERGAWRECGEYLLNKEDTQQSRRRSEKNFEKIEKRG